MCNFEVDGFPLSSPRRVPRDFCCSIVSSWLRKKTTLRCDTKVSGISEYQIPRIARSRIKLSELGAESKSAIWTPSLNSVPITGVTSCLISLLSCPELFLFERFQPTVSILAVEIVYVKDSSYYGALYYPSFSCT